MIPDSLTHFISFDFHPNVSVAIIFMSLTQDDEAFVWHELDIDPKKNTTLIIAEEMLDVIGGKEIKLALIDPLAKMNQTTTGTSVLEDLNHYFREFKKQGRCGRIYFEVWDTKSNRGIDVVRSRLINSSLARKPFSNKVVKKGRSEKLQTLWVDRYCKTTLKSLYKWRMGKNQKEPEQKFSHHCRAIECLFKDKRVKPSVQRMESDAERRRRITGSGNSSFFKRR